MSRVTLEELKRVGSSICTCLFSKVLHVRRF
jgi:hypothetical protein